MPVISRTVACFYFGIVERKSFARLLAAELWLLFGVLVSRLISVLRGCQIVSGALLLKGRAWR